MRTLTAGLLILGVLLGALFGDPSGAVIAFMAWVCAVAMWLLVWDL